MPNLDLRNDVKAEANRKSGNIQRAGPKQVINPEDASALAYALGLKKESPATTVEVLSMGPANLAEKLKDLVRIGADKAVLITDPSYAASDSYATSLILSSYLQKANFDFLFTGTKTLDGETGHIGPQVAEALNLDQFSNVQTILEMTMKQIEFEADFENEIIRARMSCPAVISVGDHFNSGQKLGFVKYDDLGREVGNQFIQLSNSDLQVDLSQVGRKGSPTIVRHEVAARERKKKTTRHLLLDNQAIDEVYEFLKENHYV
ncbi:electron transfer flavoprotein subunit beta/FixA family protein [Lactovum odontotermitis]